MQSRFHHGSFCMDDHAVLHIGVGLAQAHPNYVINNYCQLYMCLSLCSMGFNHATNSEASEITVPPY